MEKMIYTKTKKLDRIVCFRMNEADYNAIIQISQRNQSKVSNIIRIIINNVIDLIHKNNIKGKC